MKPLAGVRVLDFGIGGVGVEASRLLGEYGADVIKVETRTYPDFIRLVSLSEISPSFTSSSRSKRSLGLNVKTERGLALVRERSGHRGGTPGRDPARHPLPRHGGGADLPPRPARFDAALARLLGGRRGRGGPVLVAADPRTVPD